jgi:hypothetical protein
MDSLRMPDLAIGSRSGRFAGVDAASRLRAVVLLAGAVRQTQLSGAIQRSLLDLPVTDAETVGTLWHAHATNLARAAGIDTLPVRILVDRQGTPPDLPALNGAVALHVESDLTELRGTGGILRDCAASYGPDDLILVANGGQILIEPLEELAQELLAARADVALIAHEDATPGGMFLVTCSTLEGIRSVGFMDFKEQVLPRLVKEGRRIAVVKHRRTTGQPVRTLDGYLAGIRTWLRRCAGEMEYDDPFREDWEPAFAVVEAGAAVDASATIHDSVVLKGARVERGAVVVRSVVCPGAVVRAGQTVADRIVSTDRGRPA